MKLGIYLPTYHRPEKLQEVAINIEQATTSDFKLYFGVELEDVESFKAAKATGHALVFNKYDPEFGYSNTIQSIYEESNEEVIFHANDDFHFPQGWDEAPMLFLAEHPEIMVLGVHDGMPNPSYSTISFIRREYIERYSGVVDMPRRVFYPYHHNYVDTEFTLTAQARGVWAKLEVPCITHNRVGGDATYAKNEATSHEDARTFESRRHLWENVNLKEQIMPRKPMSEEQRQAARERMQARWAEKKASQSEKPAEPVETSTPTVKAVPVVSGGIDEAMSYIEKALEVMAPIKQRNLDMAECVQMCDALQEAKNRAGQVQGLLR